MRCDSTTYNIKNVNVSEHSACHIAARWGQIIARLYILDFANSISAKREKKEIKHPKYDLKY